MSDLVPDVAAKLARCLDRLERISLGIDEHCIVPVDVLLVQASLSRGRPINNALAATIGDREECRYLRAAYTVARWRQHAQRKQLLCYPCDWCGEPTGNWCDGCASACTRAGAPLVAICTACDKHRFKCRSCSGDSSPIANAPAVVQAMRTCFPAVVMDAADNVIRHLGRDGQ